MCDIKSFEELYPFKSHYLDINGLKYHYLDEGDGPVIVMLHGNPTWSFYYRNLAIALRGKYRVIVPDHIGCGYSDKPQDYPYRLKNHVDNLNTLIAHLNIQKLSMFFHDWGGLIGLGYATDNPEKIERIVVFNSSPSLTKKFPFLILLCRIPILGNLAVRGMNYFAVAATHLACKKREKMTPEIKAGYLKPYNNYANRIATLRFVEDIPFTKKHPTWKTAKSIQAKLDKLQNKPMLICWGMLDFCFTEHFLHLFREKFPNATVHEFDDAGHYVVEDAIDEILPLVQDFMN